MGSVPAALLLTVVAILSAGSGLYAGASFVAQQAPNLTITTTIYVATTRLTTSTIWSTTTQVVEDILTTMYYVSSTSTVTITGEPNTKLLLHMDGVDGSQAFIDSSSQAYSITAVGNAQIDTAQYKYGGASGLFDGAGDYLSVPDSADWYFGSGDFTVDFWIRFNALPSTGSFATVMSQYTPGTGADQTWFILRNVAGTYNWEIGCYTGKTITIQIQRSTSVSANTWYHVAFVRSGNSWYIFQGGTQLGAVASDPDPMVDVAGALQIGRYDAYGPADLNGWLDDFRVTKGLALWTSNFTPP